MSDYLSKLAYWTKELAKFDDLLKPILNVPFTEDSSITEIKKEVDELGISESANEIVNEIICIFPKVNSAQRQAISNLINTNYQVLWALNTSNHLVTLEDLENQILWFIIRDQGRDTRDAILELNELINRGEKLGLDVTHVMKRYSQLASTKDKYGWGSTQDLILRSIKNC